VRAAGDPERCNLTREFTMRWSSLFGRGRASRTAGHSTRPFQLEQLETRDAPAALVSPTRMTYRDVDGDVVAVTFTRPVLSANNANFLFGFDTGTVDGQTSVKQQLRKIDLSFLSTASGTGVSVVATRDPVLGGDGYAAVGQIDATGRDLGAVFIDGDLGRIVAGDVATSTSGVKGLSAASLGRYGTSTGAPDLMSAVQGPLGYLRVKGDMLGASVVVKGGADGRIGPVAIGGSVLGGADYQSGRIFSEGDMGAVTIRGDLKGGSASSTGLLWCSGRLPSLVIGGSLVGTSRDFTGEVFCKEAGSITIGRDVVGGSANAIFELINSGYVSANRIARLTIGGSLIAGTDTTSATFRNSGAVRTSRDLGTVLIKGDVIGNPTNPAIISAGGQATPTGTTDIAIGTLRVRGRVEFGLILAGVTSDGTPTNADAQIGSVVVAGDWIASSMAAGAMAGNGGYFGDGNDFRMTGQFVKDDPAVSSRIGALSIAGQVLGTLGGTDHYGIVAETVGSITVGGTVIPVTTGNNNDEFYLGMTGDFAVDEV